MSNPNLDSDINVTNNPNTPEDELRKALYTLARDSRTYGFKEALGESDSDEDSKILDKRITETLTGIRQDRTNLITQLEAKKYNNPVSNFGVSFNARIDTAIEVLRGEL